VADAVEVGLAGTAGESVKPEGDLGLDLRERSGEQAEGGLALEVGVAVEFVAGEADELALELAEDGLGVFVADLELFPDFVVKVFKELLPGGGHGFIDLEAEFELEFVEGILDLIRLATLAVDGGDEFFEIDAGADGTEDFVARSEDTLEEVEFLGEELVDALVGGVLFVEKVDDDDVVLLPVALLVL